MKPSGEVILGVAVGEYIPKRADGGKSVSTDLDTGAVTLQPQHKHVKRKSNNDERAIMT